MADDIRIKVGVSSSVKAGMDGVVRDVNAGSTKITKAAVDSGRGIKEAFGKALTGDISGAVEDLQNRMGKGMGGMAAKATVWGAGIATAFVAGWKAGVKIDEMLGVSDKLGGWLAKQFGTQEDELTRIKLEGLKKRGEAARAADAEEQRRAAQGLADITAAARLETEMRIDAIEAVEDAKGNKKADEAQGVNAEIVRRNAFEDAGDMQAEADRLTRRAFDKDFRRGEDAAAKQTAQEDRRRKRLERMAGILGEEDLAGMTEQEQANARREGMRAQKNNPMLRRVAEAADARQKAADAQNNLDQLQRRAFEAQLQAAIDQAETAKNTRELAGLKALLAMK